MKLSSNATFRLAALLGVCAAHAQISAPNFYIQTNLVSNVKDVAPVVDPNLVDPWGISLSPTSPFWISNHLSGTSTLYNGQGAVNATVVAIPSGAASAGAMGRPTGQVRNGTATAFLLPAPNGKAASFIFATEDGTISGWNGGGTSVVMVDNSARKAVYKGLAIGNSPLGPTLYAANFRSGKIDVFDATWASTQLPPNVVPGNPFFDPAVPTGFAPFNIWNLSDKLYVTWAKQDANQYLDVAGAGNGYVSIFDLNGRLVTHLASAGVLNSPWGVAVAPPVWGAFGGAVLVGNFGDGKINAFNATTGAALGTLQDPTGVPISIAGLWALIIGNGGNGGDTKTVYFTAGVPNGSSTPRGILGSIAPPATIVSVINSASQLSGPVAPGEIVEITGQTVGPSPAVAAKIPPTTPVLATTLGKTSVTVNGTPAPIIYVNGGQTNIQIPYEIAGATSASIVLKIEAQTTAAFTVPVAPTAPGLFTLDFTGVGPIVALNADGSVNSAAKPATRGTMIWIFATGEGVTSPVDKTGASETDMSRVPVAPVTVSINGSPATLGPAGSTPMDVSGVLEMQVTIPASIPVGMATIALSSGGVATTQATNIFVK